MAQHKKVALIRRNRSGSLHADLMSNIEQGISSYEVLTGTKVLLSELFVQQSQLNAF